MPSSGYPSVDLIQEADKEVYQAKLARLVERARHAMNIGMFTEWLEAFVGAWNETHDSDIASWAGLEEWDM